MEKMKNLNIVLEKEELTVQTDDTLEMIYVEKKSPS